MAHTEVTIKEMARILGLSKSTVSRALTEHSDVNPETRKKVVELARKMNYQPNALALNLKRQRSNTIGVIIPETVNRFFAKAIGGIQQVANALDYNVMICQSNESIATEKSNLRSLMAAHVDGLLISVSRETNRTDHFNALLEKNIPIVFFDRICENLQVPKVYTDNFEIALEGTEHLIQQGCQRIAFVAGPQHLFNASNRLKGYLEALKKHNLPVNEQYIIHSQYRDGNIEEYTRYLINLDKRPDAVFAINDYAAIEMMHVIKKNGLRIPDDIAVMGFNNENICKFVEPSLTTIELPSFDMGMAAAQILLAHLKNPALPQEDRLIKSQLVIRESTHRMKRG